MCRMNTLPKLYKTLGLVFYARGESGRVLKCPHPGFTGSHFCKNSEKEI